MRLTSLELYITLFAAFPISGASCVHLDQYNPRSLNSILKPVIKLSGPMLFERRFSPNQFRDSFDRNINSIREDAASGRKPERDSRILLKVETARAFSLVASPHCSIGSRTLGSSLRAHGAPDPNSAQVIESPLANNVGVPIPRSMRDHALRTSVKSRRHTFEQWRNLRDLHLEAWVRARRLL